MKVKVKQKFGDKGNFMLKYEVDQVVEFEDTRAKELIAIKLVEIIEDKKPSQKQTDKSQKK